MQIKKLPTILIALLVIAGAIAAWVLTQRPKATSIPSSSYAAEVKNLESPKLKLTEAQKTMIKSYISSTLVAKYGEGKYEATYREGSYIRTVTPEGGIISNALIDVAAKKETYRVTWTGGDNDPYGTSYVRCAPESDQLVHPSICKELAND